MKFRLISMLALSLLIVTSAFAGSGGVNITGIWVGEGKAMYVDGTTADIAIQEASIYQEEDFVYGSVLLTYTIGEVTSPPQPGRQCLKGDSWIL